MTQVYRPLQLAKWCHQPAASPASDARGTQSYMKIICGKQTRNNTNMFGEATAQSHC